MSEGKRLLIAGGGTGGHLFPGVSLAEEFLSRNKANKVLFVGTRNGIEAEALPKRGFDVAFVSVAGLKRVSLIKKLMTIFVLPLALFQSWRILRRFKPNAVIGVGGFASGPTVLAAALTGRYTAIQEQNSFAGLTNKILSRFVKRVFIAFKAAERFFPKKKILLMGNPIRGSMVEAARKRIEGGADAERSDDKFRLLVFGGSQGAVAVNSAVSGALKELKDILGGMSVLHQSGKVGHEALLKEYEGVDLDLEVTTFIDDMEKAYGEADLVICRSGAISIAEITALGKPCILVPFPFAADDHQTKNAEALADTGAAIVMPQSSLTAEKLAETIRGLYENRKKLAGMTERARELGRPEAAARIVDVCLEEAEGKRR